MVWPAQSGQRGLAAQQGRLTGLSTSELRWAASGRLAREVLLCQAGCLGSRTSYPVFACDVLEIQVPFAAGRSLGKIRHCPTWEDGPFTYPKMHSPMVLSVLRCYVVYTVVQAWRFCSCPGTRSLEQGGGGGQTGCTVGEWELAPFLQLIWLQVSTGVVPCGDHLAQHLASDSSNRRGCLGKMILAAVHLPNPCTLPTFATVGLELFSLLIPLGPNTGFLAVWSKLQVPGAIQISFCPVMPWAAGLELSDIEARATYLHSELASYSC